MPKLGAIKPMSALLSEAHKEGEHELKRALGPLNLITLGIGAVIGAGIFVLTGQAAAIHAGPAVTLSFIVAGITCAFAGLCYAEFAALIPIAGSAYTYGYATLGEFVAWMIGWDLVLEYAFGAASVSSGWSGYLVSLLQDFHIYIPPRLTTTPGDILYLYKDHWLPMGSLPMGINTAGMPHVTGVFNLVAFLALLVVTLILVVGIEESANLNTAMVLIKLAAVGVFLVIGVGFLLHHPHLAKLNWHPYIPPSRGSGPVWNRRYHRRSRVHFLRLHRLRCCLHSGARSEKSAARYAHRHPGHAGDLHAALHSCLSRNDRHGQL